MTDETKLLRAFIEAQGYEVEEVEKEVILRDAGGFLINQLIEVDYKVTKLSFKNRPTLHKIIRQYEKEGMSASEMIGRIMLMEGITNEDL